MDILNKTITVRAQGKRSYTVSNDRLLKSLAGICEKVQDYCNKNYYSVFPWDAVEYAEKCLVKLSWFNSISDLNKDILKNLVGYYGYSAHFPDSVEISDFENISKDDIDIFQDKIKKNKGE